jgi:hypothetical protein
MNQSAALNLSTPAKYPSKYSHWNTTVNQEVLDGAITGIGGAINLNGAFKLHVAVLAANGLIPAVGIVQYEGGQSNEPQGNAPNGIAMTANPLFQEFWPQAVNTIEDGAVWAAMVSTFADLPRFTGQPTLRVSYPSKFVDSGNITHFFGFGGLTYVDHYLGIGAPNWQNTASPGGLWKAVLATN